MSIARNTLVTTAGNIATIAVALVTVPLYISAIGLERYGILAVVWTILAYFGLADLGVSGAMVQRLASKSMPSQQRVVLYWTGFSLNAAMGLVGGVILLLSFNSIMSLMTFSTQEVQGEVQSASLAVALLIVVMTLRPINNSVLYGSERFIAATVLSTFEAVASAIVPLAVALWVSNDIYWLIVSILVVRAVFVVASFVAMIPSVPGFRLAVGKLSVARDLLSTGIWFLLAGIIGPLLTYFDRFLIGSMVGVSRLPFYSVPQMILQQSSHVPRAFGSVLFPRFSAIEDESEAIRLAVAAMHAMAFVVTPICALLILGAEPILKMWLSTEFADNASIVAILLMSSLLPSALARILTSRLNGRNRPDLVVKILLIEALPYAIALYYLTKEFGLVGVAIVWTLRTLLDAILLGVAGNVLPQMLKLGVVPTGIVCISMVVSIAWGLDDPQRWISSAGTAVLIFAWVTYFMPPPLAQRLSRIRILRWLPVGKLHGVRLF